MTEMPKSLLALVPFLWQRMLFPAPAIADTLVRIRSLALVLILPAVLLYPWMQFHLLEPDEGRYAQIPREMLQGGSWVVPTLQGDAYLDKPPLMYWLVALSYHCFGVSEWAARLVPALCVHATILAVYLLGRRSLGERPAFWAAMLLTVAPGYLSIARLLLLDGLLTMCVTLSVLCGFEAVRTGTFKRFWWYAAAIASGFGFLTKGPIAELLLFIPLFAFTYLNQNTARVRLRDLLLFGAIVLGINTPWYLAMYLKEPTFLGYFFWEHNVMRFLQPFDHLQPIWFYVPILLGGLLPGTLLFVPYLKRLLLEDATQEADQVRSQAGGFWLLAGCWCLFFFSVSGSKLPTYILPAYPFLCLALGEFVARTNWDHRWLTRGFVGTFAVLILGFHSVGLPWYARERSPFGQPEILRKYAGDEETTVVTYPRNCDSVAFYLNRSDFDRVRSKGINQLMVDMHHRPKTVILFSHAHSFEAFRHAMPESLEVAESITLKRKSGRWWEKWLGNSPWGLTDIAVIRPHPTARARIGE